MREFAFCGNYFVNAIVNSCRFGINFAIFSGGGVSTQARTSMLCIARCDLRFGLRSSSEAFGIQCGTRFSKLWSVAPRQIGDTVWTYTKTAELERPPRVAHDLGLATLDRAADGGG